tara:strand:- start:540 stop:1172 length:633 start_codon:yes stop_codon:yes gene_type:complete
MRDKQIKGKGILSKLLEQGVRILLIKECKKIRNITIDIISNTTQIIKGEIQKINIIAEDINYKNLLFDKVELEANHLNINIKIKTKELSFKNDPIIKLKISLSQNSLKKVLSSNNWSYIENMISKELLNEDKLKDIRINDGLFLIIDSEESNTIKNFAHIEINVKKGKIYLKNKIYKKTIQIPIEEKIYIENVIIENNLINIFANSSISF